MSQALSSSVLANVVDGHDRVLVDQREHVGRQQHGDVAAALPLLSAVSALTIDVLIGAGIDRLHLDAGIGLLEVGGIAVDDLGDRAADRDRIVERDLGCRCALSAPSDACRQRWRRLSAERICSCAVLPCFVYGDMPPARTAIDAGYRSRRTAARGIEQVRGRVVPDDADLGADRRSAVAAGVRARIGRSPILQRDEQCRRRDIRPP